MRECGCGIFVACDYHDKMWADADKEINSYQIAQGLSKSANKGVEDAIFRAEEKAAKFHLVCDFLLCVVAIAVLFYICV